MFELDVPRDNYLFIKGVLSVFGNKFGEPPRNPREEENCVWDQLALSYEAYRRGIVVGPDEIEAEVKKILEADKVGFDFKADRPAYEKWVKEKVNAPVELFENQIRHLIQLEKTRQQVMNTIEPRVSEAEARREFLNEYNSLSVELVEFAGLKESRYFYDKAKGRWEFGMRRRPPRQKIPLPGFVALEFLMDIWRFQGCGIQDAEIKSRKPLSAYSYI